MSEKIKTLQTIHLALCAGLLTAYIFAGNLSLDSFLNVSIEPAQWPYLGIPVAAFLLSNFLFRFFIKKIDARLSFEEKITEYQTASLIRWAILEGAAFVLIFVTPELIAFGVLLIVYLAYLRPTEQRIKEHLQHLA
ncbi:hypothetical protein SAMN02927903_01757 [Flavobacterium caeni]|uniref:Uncharacterized protein n=2 Tax=Flavobacterium caeni TaxID=490189 RepID=A0A1G5H4D8_9FLAO|nr:hypothetical protein SAMN02927903_01757 [Flavobacterium caeni]